MLMKNTDAVMQDQDRYVMICGQGRSGTNWLLDILDQSPRTHCRNEPNEIASSPLARLPSPSVPGGDVAALERDWDPAVDWTSHHFGVRDHALPGPKDHIWAISRASGLSRAMNRRPRRIVGTVFRSLRQGEWALPRWIGSRTRLGKALPVLKFVQAPMWAAWVLANRPSVQVLHIVRHPGGFLNSWRNRYLKPRDETQVRQANRDRLEAIAKLDAAWGARFGDVAAMSVTESELWYWRYASETLHAAGSGRPQYELIVYEQLVANPLAIAKRVYEACSLPWNDRVEQSVAKSAEESGSIAKAWRTRMAPDDVAIIDRVLSDSPMKPWWD